MAHRAAHLRLGQALPQSGADEIAGLGPSLDQAPALQQVIGLGDRHRGNAMDAAALAHRRQAVTGAQHALGNQPGGVVGKGLVKTHGGRW